jgi:hypothetical protein
MLRTLGFWLDASDAAKSAPRWALRRWRASPRQFRKAAGLRFTAVQPHAMGNLLLNP